jgi:hypothetical protein
MLEFARRGLPLQLLIYAIGPSTSVDDSPHRFADHTEQLSAQIDRRSRPLARVVATSILLACSATIFQRAWNSGCGQDKQAAFRWRRLWVAHGSWSAPIRG